MWTWFFRPLHISWITRHWSLVIVISLCTMSLSFVEEEFQYSDGVFCPINFPHWPYLFSRRWCSSVDGRKPLCCFLPSATVNSAPSKLFFFKVFLVKCFLENSLAKQNRHLLQSKENLARSDGGRTCNKSSYSTGWSRTCLKRKVKHLTSQERCQPCLVLQLRSGATNFIRWKYIVLFTILSATL